MTTPKNKKTLATTFRTDLRLFATIAKWLRNQGIVAQSRSQVLELGLATLGDLLIKNDPSVDFVKTETALEYVTEIGLMQGGGGRARVAIARAIQEEAQLSLPGTKAGKRAERETRDASHQDVAQAVAELMANRERDEALTTKPLGKNLFNKK